MVGSYRYLLLALMVALNTTAQQNGNYSKYFEQIVLIENSIADEHFPAAVKGYRKLFDQYERVFARDAYNACVLSAYAFDSIQFMHFFYRCAVAGVPYSLLKDVTWIAPRLQHVLFDSLYTAGHARFRSSIDTALRAEFIRRYKLEQDSRSKPEYREVVAQNFRRIHELATEGRFPDEWRIGTNERLENGMVEATLKHHPNAYLLLQNYLQQSLENGGMQPLSVYTIYGFNQRRTSRLYDQSTPADTLVFAKHYNTPFSIFSVNLEEVNRNRAAVYLNTTAVAARLHEVCKRHKLPLR